MNGKPRDKAPPRPTQSKLTQAENAWLDSVMVECARAMGAWLKMDGIHLECSVKSQLDKRVLSAMAVACTNKYVELVARRVVAEPPSPERDAYYKALRAVGAPIIEPGDGLEFFLS